MNLDVQGGSHEYILLPNSGPADQACSLPTSTIAPTSGHDFTSTITPASGHDFTTTITSASGHDFTTDIHIHQTGMSQMYNLPSDLEPYHNQSTGETTYHNQSTGETVYTLESQPTQHAGSGTLQPYSSPMESYTAQRITIDTNAITSVPSSVAPILPPLVSFTPINTTTQSTELKDSYYNGLQTMVTSAVSSKHSAKGNTLVPSLVRSLLDREPVMDNAGNQDYDCQEGITLYKEQTEIPGTRVLLVRNKGKGTAPSVRVLL